MILFLQIFEWYLIILVIGLFAFPLSYRFLGSLADKGYSLSRAVGILVWAFLFWWLTTLRISSNTVGGILFSVAVFIALTYFLIARGNWKGAFAWVRENWRLVLIEEVVFLAIFALSAVLRAGNPNIEGTEKPMELAFINAIQQSQFFPPHDPWLSGYAISYYYFGYIMVAMLAKISGTAAAVAFNLSLAAWYAMGSLGAYGIVYSLLEKLTPDRKKALGMAVIAPILIFWLGNAEGFLEVLHAGGVFWQPAPDGGLQSNFWTSLDIRELRDPPSEPFDFLPKRVGGLVWWRASRVLSDYDLRGQWHEVIDEFPYFSLLLGDLHPHVLSIPFFILAIGFSAGLYFREKPAIRLENGLSKILPQPDLWAAALIAGGMAFLNIWDFPTSAGLFAGALALRKYQQNGKFFRAFLDFIQYGLLIGVGGGILYLPYFLGFSSQAGGLLPSLSFFTRGIHFWIMFATLLLPIFGYFIYQAVTTNKQGDWFPALIRIGFVIAAFWILSYLAAFLITALPALITGLAGPNSSAINKLKDSANLFLNKQGADGLADLLVKTTVRRMVEPGTWLSLMALGALTISLLMRKNIPVDPNDPPLEEDHAIYEVEKRTPVKFSAFLVLIGMAVVGFPEFFYLLDFFGNRMNTIFKFYYQGWQIWGVAAAFSLGALWLTGKRRWILLASSLSILVFLLGSAYPLLITSSKVNFSAPERWTLDGQSFFKEYNPDEFAAIHFLKQQPFGILAEAVGGSYTAYARVATFSGYPNVLGWPGHESQWRGGYTEMGSRGTDIERLYRTTNWTEAREILQRYSIRYVYVGSLEYSAYAPNLLKFDQNLTKIFDQNGVLIYQVPLDLAQGSGGKP